MVARAPDKKNTPYIFLGCDKAACDHVTSESSHCFFKTVSIRAEFSASFKKQRVAQVLVYGKTVLLLLRILSFDSFKTR